MVRNLKKKEISELCKKNKKKKDEMRKEINKAKEIGMEVLNRHRSAREKYERKTEVNIVG